MKMKNAILERVLNRYEKKWNEQDVLFRRNGLENCFPRPVLLRNANFSSDERKRLLDLDKEVETQVLKRVNDIVGERLIEDITKDLDIEKARNLLGFHHVKSIPLAETQSLSEFYYSIPSKLGISKAELIWLFENGYLPHLYWNKGKPRFDRRMWFILDFVLRKVREKIGLGIFNNFSDWRPDWRLLKRYIYLIEYMYNSWKLGECVLDCANKNARKMGWKGEEFRSGRYAIERGLWVTEGRVLAEDLISNSPFNSVGNINELAYYRDVFALLSYDIYALPHLIDFYHKPDSRAGFMFGFEFKAKVSVHNMGIGDINTYRRDDYSSAYGHLLASMDWALSMKEKRKTFSVLDIVQKYNYRRKDDTEKILCPYCHTLFVPKRRTYSVTCGKPSCINTHRSYLKKHPRLGISPIID